MTLTTVGSGSSGNCYVLQDENEALIIEAGMKLIEVKKALGWNIAKVVGCVITHSHNDHAGYAKDYESAGLSLLALPDVIHAKRLTMTKAITIGKRYRMGGFDILPFPVMHDVPCVGFIITHADTGRILFATDTYALARWECDAGGKEYVIPYTFTGIAHWMLEANYSDRILRRNIENGNIPEVFRKRLMTSHMSIHNCIDTFKRMDLSKTHGITLIHLSDGNADEKDFVKRVREATGKRTYVAKPGLRVNIDLGIV